MNTEWMILYTVCGLTAFFILGLFIIGRLLKISHNNEKSSDIDWLSPPKDSIVVNDNIRIAYRQHGSGPDLLLIHGIGANTFCWRLVHENLCSKFRVTCFDLPGFGYSSKNRELQYDLDNQSKRVLSFINKLGLKKPILLGSSMGGSLALWLSLLHPQTFPKVVAISPAAGVRLIPIIFRKIKNVSFFLNWGLNKNTMILILKRIFSKKSLVNEYTIKGYLQPYLNNKTESIHCFVNSKSLIMDPRLPKCFKNLKNKPLILTGKKDHMVRKSNIQDLLEVLPKHEFHLHPHGGHHLMEDDADWVLEKTLNFLK